MLASCVQQRNSVTRIPVSVLSRVLFPHRWLQSAELHSLCWAAGPCFHSAPHPGSHPSLRPPFPSCGSSLGHPGLTSCSWGGLSGLRLFPSFSTLCRPSCCEWPVALTHLLSSRVPPEATACWPLTRAFPSTCLCHHLLWPAAPLLWVLHPWLPNGPVASPDAHERMLPLHYRFCVSKTTVQWTLDLSQMTDWTLSWELAPVNQVFDVSASSEPS